MVVEATFAGVGRHVVDLSRALVARGHTIHLAYSPVRMEECFQNGITGLENLHVHSLPMTRSPSLRDLHSTIALRRCIRKHGPFDVIHGHSSKGGAIARLAGAGTGAARVYTAHAFRTLDPNLGRVERVLYESAESLLGRHMTETFIGVTQEEVDEGRRLGIRPERALLVPNGIELPPLPARANIRRRLGLAEDHVCLMWVGRLAPQKAPDRFVRLFARLAAETAEATAVMIGSGPLEAEVHTLVGALGLRERLRVVEDQRAVESMPGADIYVMTSCYEGLPYVLLEAQSVGLPVVGFEAGGLRAAIEHGTTGFALAQSDEPGFLDVLRRLIADPGLRRAMGIMAARRAGCFRLDRMVERTEAIYQALVDQRWPVASDDDQQPPRSSAEFRC